MSINFYSIKLSCYQSFTKDLLQVRDLSTLDKKGSLSLRKSQALRGIPAQGESHLTCSPVLIQEELKLDLSKSWSLVKGLSALGSNLEVGPTSRGDHHHAAILPIKGSPKAAHLGCRNYGKKWLGPNQVA